MTGGILESNNKSTVFMLCELNQRRVLELLVFCVVFLLFDLNIAHTEHYRVGQPNQPPNDRRLGPLKSLEDSYPFSPSSSPEEWAKRSKRIRRQFLVAAGLWPMPTKNPANAIVHGKVDREDFTVEKVYLESFPGHFVTGNLYRPRNRNGRRPAVLSPHGHFTDGRYDSIVQERCVQLARMGCVVFAYDMLGFGDSQQLSFELAHRSIFRPEMNTAEDWGYYSPQSELRMQSIFGLQTYNSIRALDWLCGLPDVDSKRVGVTGASGGGAQTMYLCAIDPRPAVAFPAVHVSTVMQGRCTCENASHLRRDSGNIEFCALIAPRPLGMTGANDWTIELATKGLPELKQHYKMLGAEGLVMGKVFPQFRHNFNAVSRGVMYNWFNKHLKLGLVGPIIEKHYQLLSIEELRVWNTVHPKPAGGDDYERALLSWITRDSRRQIAGLMPKTKERLIEYRRIVGGAVDVLIGRGLPSERAIRVRKLGDEQHDGWDLAKLSVDYPEKGEKLPVIRLQPSQWNHQVVIWIDSEGKQSLFDREGQPRPLVRKLLTSGSAVVGVDLFGQGEFTADGKPLPKNRLNFVKRGKWGKYAGFTFAYNDSLFAQRVHDVISVVSYARHCDQRAERVSVIGLSGAGHWVAAARAQVGDAIDRVAIDTIGFRFAGLENFDDPDFLPGVVKYNDLPGIIALSVPHPMWLAGEGSDPLLVTTAYKAAGASEKLTIYSVTKVDKESAAVEWLLR